MVFLPDRQKERVGARELADQFELSPRTIYRDIDAINRAGIPVFQHRDRPVIIVPYFLPIIQI
jgi:predicted DNA-binding transcriptional regulator YafY